MGQYMKDIRYAVRVDIIAHVLERDVAEAYTIQRNVQKAFRTLPYLFALPQSSHIIGPVIDQYGAHRHTIKSNWLLHPRCRYKHGARQYTDSKLIRKLFTVQTKPDAGTKIPLKLSIVKTISKQARKSMNRPWCHIPKTRMQWAGERKKKLVEKVYIYLSSIKVLQPASCSLPT